MSRHFALSRAALVITFALITSLAHAAAPAAGATGGIREVQIVAGHVVFLADYHEPLASHFDLYSAPVGGGAATRLSGTLPALAIEQFAVTRSGRVVFAGRETGDGRRYLYSIPVAGGWPTRLGPTYPPGSTYDLGRRLVFRLAGERAIFTVDAKLPNGFELFSVPVEGGEVVNIARQLPPTTDRWPEPFWVTGFTVGDDNRTVVYRLFGFPAAPIVGLFRVGSSLSQLMDDCGPQGEFRIAPGGSWLVCSTDRSLRTVGLEGGEPIEVDYGSHIPFRFTGDRVVYAVRGDSAQIKSAPLAGGTPVVVAANVSYAGADTFQLTPDGSSVLYSAAERAALLRAPVLGGEPSVVMAAPVSAPIAFTADWARALFVASPGAAPGLYSYPLAGGPAARIDDPAHSAGGALSFEGVAAAGRAIYAARAAGGMRLYSVPVGGGAATQLSDELGPGQELMTVVGATPDGHVIFMAGSAAAPPASRWRHLYSVPLDGSAPPRPLYWPEQTVALPLVGR